MTNTIGVAGLVLPVFGLIGLGYLISWFKILSQESGEALSDFVFTVAIPVLIFRTLATADLPAISPWPLWLSYFAGVAMVWTLADLSVRKLFGRDARAGVVAGISAGYSNLVLVGIPMVYAAFGDAGTVPLFILISIHLPVMMSVSTISISRVEKTGNGDPAGASAIDLAKNILRNLLFNPIILGIIAGGIWRFAGLPISGLPKTLIDQLAVTAAPCALFSLGMALRRYGIGGNLAPAMILSGLKVFLLPLVVWLIATTATDLPPLWVAVATVGAACPAGINAYLIANRFRTGHALASNTITLTTLVSVVTMTAWLTLLGAA